MKLHVLEDSPEAATLLEKAGLPADRFSILMKPVHIVHTDDGERRDHICLVSGVTIGYDEDGTPDTVTLSLLGSDPDSFLHFMDDGSSWTVFINGAGEEVGNAAVRLVRPPHPDAKFGFTK